MYCYRFVSSRAAVQNSQRYCEYFQSRQKRGLLLLKIENRTENTPWFVVKRMRRVGSIVCLLEESTFMTDIAWLLQP